MFNWIKNVASCVKCGNILTEWQSKDMRKDEDLACDYYLPADVNNFYENCDKCDTWNEYIYVPKTEKVEKAHWRFNSDFDSH